MYSRLEIKYDECAENPITAWDNLGTVIDWHSRYNFGAEKLGRHQDEIDEWVEEHSDNHIIVPLYLYDHGGQTVSTNPFNCPWDSGQVGFIYVSYDKIKSEYGQVNKEILANVEGYLKNEVKVFNDYLTGQVYGYILYDENDEEVDSCWGFYGSNHVKSGLADYLPVEARYLLDKL